MAELDDREWDMLLTLWHLRYMTTGQMQRRWYVDRNANGARIRLSRLGKAKVVEVARVGQPKLKCAWRIGRVGLEMLAEHVGRGLKPYQPLSVFFIPHLIETNELFFELASTTEQGTTRTAWHDLAFDWCGSHRAGLPFTVTRRDAETGAVKKRNRLLRPDAIVAPRRVGDNEFGTPQTAVRVLIELDRGTEAIVSSTGRTDIAAKLRAYRTLLTARAPDGRTWYTSLFEDADGGRVSPPRVLFVVPASRRRSERKESVDAAIAKLNGDVRARFRCITADDVEALRDFCGLRGAGSMQPAAPGCRDAGGNACARDAHAGPAGQRAGAAAGDCPIALSRQSWSDLRAFYRISIEAYRRLRPESSVRPRFKEAARRVHEQLFAACGPDGAGPNGAKEGDDAGTNGAGSASAAR